MYYPRSRHIRRGVAAVEMAFLMPLMLALIIGLWEMGSFIQAQQIMNDAAREGARLASQAVIINSTGAFTDITVNSSNPNVTTTVSNYIQVNGITNVTGLNVSFQFLTGNTTLTDPYQGTQGQMFQVTVTMPYSNVQWSPLGLVNPTTIGGTCVWALMVDYPIVVNTTLPTWTAIAANN
jgi:Flp pilus assembly protein TadG